MLSPTVPPAAAPPLLELRDIDAFYGPVQALSDVSLHVDAGELVCLLGGNASGKSTTMKVILGLVPVRAGRVLLDGGDITGLPTPQIIRRGVGSVPEARRIFGGMTVRENLLMGAYLRDDRAAVDADYARALELFPRLAERLGQRGGTLSGGEQQMLAIGRAFMSRPRLMILDEPTMGLSPLYVDRVLDVLSTMHRGGLTLFMVEQNAELALQIATRGYVLANGRIVLEGSAHNLESSPAVQDAYLGGMREEG